jgi:DNA-directed RNA polymerase subunit RPC12/RpoP
MPQEFVSAVISAKELQSMAELVKVLHASGRIDADQRRLFMQAIAAGDSQGNLWTIGTQTGKWFRKTGDGWLEGQPPETLLLVVPEKAFREADAQLAEYRLELEIKALRANRCPNCGSRFAAGALFCSSCGTAVAGAQPPPERRVNRCRACGQLIEGDPYFCSKCGAKLR